jgi:hypothetical protein
MWQLQPTPRRREVANLIMEMLCRECAGHGGAADAAAGLCLALAETIAANTLPGNWESKADMALCRVREEFERISAADRPTPPAL